jgi:hypothetical protein
MSGRFTYSVHERTKIKSYSPHTHATFEEVRQAGKAALDATLAEWRRCELVRQLA